MTNLKHPGAAPGLPRLLTVDAVAERLDLSRKTIRRLIKAGELRKHQIGLAIRVSEDDLAMFVRMSRK